MYLPIHFSGNHNFELTTFEEACLCDICNKLLCGCYFQGYYCQGGCGFISPYSLYHTPHLTGCKKSAHYSCLGSVRACSSMHPPALPPSRHPPIAPRHSLQGTDHVPPSPRTLIPPRRGSSMVENEMPGNNIRSISSLTLAILRAWSYLCCQTTL